MGSGHWSIRKEHSGKIIPQVSSNIMKVFICCLLIAGASCLPGADPQFLYHAGPVPVLYNYKPVSVKVVNQANCIFEGVGSGEVVGEIILTETETPDGGTEVRIAGELSNLSPGLHGFHVHEKGDLSDNCVAAGSHYNPFGIIMELLGQKIDMLVALAILSPARRKLQWSELRIILSSSAVTQV